ncbi:hypothetical protein CC1G_00880 [Coprinopsis cinerea okayama7|uniref:ZW10 C-terminal helical domain-containing protein n=1 Tax=Coprinopsis cinerea (strain Okayama-7 / 130 / ATCC MYA-4618 / FGSC 9003) TaxID=240176 RepID=A8N905_COPC7|nr:hypothetical protein CC1G_00880 [Coprinopsis cinerea okayama7\|eukprot:XP_001831333.1 hypothetical protein CC1G_00880 [Coprinopsis cinerea okayama7\
MAFEIPQHLPRKALPQDVSSKILNRIDQALVKDLDANLANSWVTELDESISATKTRIHDRIQEDLPKFQHQLETSKSVQTRTTALGKGIEDLNEKISSPSGLLPTTLHRLQVHATLQQQANDATIIADSLAHLLKCKQQYTSLLSLVKLGKLPEAVVASSELEKTCSTSPKALENAVVLKDLKHKLQTLKARVEEQLLDALSNILIIQPTRLAVRSEVSIPNSDATVTLEAILTSLSLHSLEDYLSTFRKHLTTYFVENVLQQPYSVGEGMTMTERALNLIPTSPNSESRRIRLENLAHIFDFINAHIFPRLPPSQSSLFLRSLAKPLTASILNLFLIPQLPSSFGLLPQFLELVKQAVEFEEEYIIKLLKVDARDRPLKEWANNLSGHYERQRRNIILDNCRSLLKEPMSASATFLAEVQQSVETSFPTAVNGDEAQTSPEEDSWGFDDDANAKMDLEQAEDSWGFDDDVPQENGAQVEDSWGLDDDAALQDSSVVDNGWGFDDDIEPETEATEEDVQQPNGTHEGSSSPSETPDLGEGEPDADDAWGLDQDPVPADESGEQASSDDPWDDPWGDPAPELEESAPAPVPAKAPKVAKRLEKLASKTKKKQMNGSALHHSPSPSPPPPPPPSLPPSSTQETVKQGKGRARTASAPKPAAIVTKVHPPVEQYRVTERTNRIVRTVEDAIAEGKQFAASNLFAKFATTSTPGTTLFQTATAVLDLYQAFYPVKLEAELQKIEGALQFSNDCLYLGEAVEKLEQEVSGQASLKERLEECKRHLGVLADSWLQDAVESECRRHVQLLSDGCEGFTYTMDQDRYDECESTINQVVRSIKDLARRIKPILSKTKYYQTLGRFVDTALSRTLQDIVALPDITEVESHRLSELCRIFNSVEGLFSEDPNQPSFVVAYVPSWLKFNYMSELLEASLADITYLFEEGALVDFEVDELVRLVRALFADTPLRTNTINKILAGQSQSSS